MIPSVLVIEDDEDIREALAGVLSARGFEVMAARHGRDALDRTAASQLRPSVIVLDLMMPVMDGEAFLGAQPAAPLLADVPVIVVTAQLALPFALPASVRAVLRKPVALQDLLVELRAACGVPQP